MSTQTAEAPARTTLDWSKFRVRINVNAAIDKIYNCWTTREGIEFWFLRRADFKKRDGSERGQDEQVQAGDSYTWWWHGYRDDILEKGEIIEANGKDRFKFIFGKAGICTVNIREEAGENIVELLQEKIPTDDHGKENFHIGCKTGWTFYLANLKSMLEGGKDLRNRNVEVQDMLNS